MLEIKSQNNIFVIREYHVKKYGLLQLTTFNYLGYALTILWHYTPLTCSSVLFCFVLIERNLSLVSIATKGGESGEERRGHCSWWL